MPTLDPFNRHWYIGEAPPFVGVAVKFTGMPVQTELPGLAFIVTTGTTVGVTEIVRLLLVSAFLLGQTAFVVIITLTIFPFVSVLLVNVLLLVPVLTPFMRHWYDGEVPPFVGEAVKVTEVPEQIVVPGLADIVTSGTRTGLTCIVIRLLVSEAGLAHGELDVIITDTTAPFVRLFVI